MNSGLRRLLLELRLPRPRVLPARASLRWRLKLLVLVLIALVTAAAALGLLGARRIVDAHGSRVHERLLQMQALRRVADAYATQIPAVVRRAAADRPALEQAAQRVEQLHADALRQWVGCTSLATSNPERALVAQAEPLIATAGDTSASIALALRAGDRAWAQQLAGHDTAAPFEPLAQVLDALAQLQLDAAREEALRGESHYQALLGASALLMLLSAVAALGLGHAVLARHRQEREAARASTVRLRRFFRALSRTNQLIVRERDEQALLVGLCRICVEVGRAGCAAVEAPQAHAGLRPHWPATDDTASPLTLAPSRALAARAMQALAPQVERHENGPAPGATAAFALCRGGRVWGALLLWSDEPGFFDTPMVSLLDDLAQDLSFALDNLDRESERRAAVEAAQQHARQLATIVETTMDGIITVDAGLRVVVFNRAAADMFGVTAADALGSPLERFLPEAAPPSPSPQARFPFAAEEVRVEGERHRITALRADGRPFPAEVSISRSGAGGAALLTALVRDVTQAVESEQARRAQAEAEAASRAKTEFLSRVSHELRTPLNAILGFAQLMREQARQGGGLGAAFEPVEHIERAGWHLLGLINDVLDFSRIEAGRLQVTPHDLLIAPLLRETARMLDTHAREAQVRLRVDCDADIVVRADATRLRQVLLNLLSNAIKYNRAGGSVRLQARRGRDWVRLTVEDTGLGMNRVQLAHLFEPFNRLGREAGPVEGSGIGLALTRELVRLMGGQLSIDSEPGAGTRARIELPCGRPVAVPAEPARGEDGAAAGPSGIVLYVEDDAVNVLVVEQMLRRLPGVQLHATASGIEAVRLARTLRPHLVLLDMQLPDINGLEVLRRLRSDASTASLPVVVLSASALPQDIERAQAGGVRAYLTKPFGLAALLEQVQRWVPARLDPLPDVADRFEQP